MRPLKIITISVFLLCAFVCCHSENKDGDYFNGEIGYFKIDSATVKNVMSKNVPAENYSYGMFAVYDSLAIFWNPKFPAHFFGIFNIDTGEEIGYFCNRGRGPKEITDVNPVFQFYHHGDDVMALLYAVNQSKLFFWNITQSINKGTTVYDTIVPYDSKTRSAVRDTRFDLYLFYQTENTLLARVASVPLSDVEATSPYYEKRTIYSNELVQDYRLYKKDTLRNKISEIMPERFFASVDALKPDGSKIVQAMRFLPQINILDTNTGEVRGYRMQNRPGFSFFEAKMMKYRIYYRLSFFEGGFMLIGRGARKALM